MVTAPRASTLFASSIANTMSHNRSLDEDIKLTEEKTVDTQTLKSGNKDEDVSDSETGDDSREESNAEENKPLDIGGVGQPQAKGIEDENQFRCYEGTDVDTVRQSWRQKKNKKRRKRRNGTR